MINLSITMLQTTLQSQEKYRYSDGELEEFRVLIEDKLEKARFQFQFFSRQMDELGDNEDARIKNLEDGSCTHEREQVTLMASRQNSLIQHLENALIRIDNKAYGVCRVTGKLIPKERLRLVPHATMSIDAKHHRHD